MRNINNYLPVHKLNNQSFYYILSTNIDDSTPNIYVLQYAMNISNIHNVLQKCCIIHNFINYMITIDKRYIHKF